MDMFRMDLPIVYRLGSTSKQCSLKSKEVDAVRYMYIVYHTERYLGCTSWLLYLCFSFALCRNSYRHWSFDIHKLLLIWRTWNINSAMGWSCFISSLWTSKLYVFTSVGKSDGNFLLVSMSYISRLFHEYYLWIYHHKHCHWIHGGQACLALFWFFTIMGFIPKQLYISAFWSKKI